MSEPLRLSVEAELNDDCSAVTFTFHEIPLGALAGTLTAIGDPDAVKQWVDGVNAQIPLKRAGLGETRKTVRVKWPSP